MIVTKPKGPHPKKQERTLKPSSHLRRQRTVREKLLIVHFAETKSNHNAARQFNIQTKQVRDYRNKKASSWLLDHGKNV